MLQLILGRSGSGKTYTVLSSLRQQAEAGQADRCLLLKDRKLEELRISDYVSSNIDSVFEN